MKTNFRYLFVVSICVTLLINFSCKNEEWFNVNGVVFFKGKKIINNSIPYHVLFEGRSSDEVDSFDMFISKYAKGGVKQDIRPLRTPLINVKIVSGREIITAKYENDEKTYLVSKNPDYKKDKPTSQFSHLINLEYDIMVYLNLDI